MAGGVRDIAARAGFSIATVSRVLNGHSNVRPETRKIILETAKALNYAPDPAAKALATRRTRIIGAVIPTIEHSIFAKFIHALEKELAASGYGLVLALTANELGTETARAEELLSMGAEGLIVSGLKHTPTLLSLCAARNVPLVCTSIYDGSSALCTIGYDNRELAQLACRYLFDLGHENIVVIHGPVANNDRTRLRIQGVSDVYADRTRVQFVERSLSVSGGTEAAQSIFGLPTVPSAILCLSDVLALGVMFEASRQAVRIPDDLSVMGFDDLDWARLAEPPLTVIRLPVTQMGIAAANAMSALLDQLEPLQSRKLLGQLIVRGSTAAVRGA